MCISGLMGKGMQLVGSKKIKSNRKHIHLHKANAIPIIDFIGAKNNILFVTMEKQLIKRFDAHKVQNP